MGKQRCLFAGNPACSGRAPQTPRLHRPEQTPAPGATRESREPVDMAMPAVFPDRLSEYRSSHLSEEGDGARGPASLSARGREKRPGPCLPDRSTPAPGQQLHVQSASGASTAVVAAAARGAAFPAAQEWHGETSTTIRAHQEGLHCLHPVPTVWIARQPEMLAAQRGLTPCRRPHNCTAAPGMPACPRLWSIHVHLRALLGCSPCYQSPYFDAARPVADVTSRQSLNENL
jgi:hypothetical protein